MSRHCDVGGTCTHGRRYATRGVGWDVMTCVALEHMVDATPHVGGVGWDVMTCVALENMVDATPHVGGVGWDVMTCVALEHMVDATPHVGWGGVVKGKTCLITCTVGFGGTHIFLMA